MKEITRIVLTGGPCAGKTTALAKIVEHFTGMGYQVFTLPEVPTMFTAAGMNYLTTNKRYFYEGEKATLEIQLALEDKFYRMAQETRENCIIVSDRGTMDISAYMQPEMWDDLMRTLGTSSAELRERYDAVLHLVSAADGAEQYYTTANNAQRYEQMTEEGLQIARSLDKKVIKAWTGHRNLRVINNHDDFDAKMKRVIREISGVLGIPQPIEHEHKYIVKINGELPADSIDIDIVQTYLVSEKGSDWQGKNIYVHSTKKTTADNEVLVTERQINYSLYEMMLSLADPAMRTIHKHRSSFIWKGQYFEIDSYRDELEGLVILETKGIEDGEPIKFPPFIEVVEDITGNTAYFNHSLAKR